MVYKRACRRSRGYKTKPIKESIIRVADLIRAQPNAYLSHIARALELHKSTVQVCLRILSPFLICTANDNTEGLPNLPICYKLKPGTTNKRILSWMKTKREVKGL